MTTLNYAFPKSLGTADDPFIGLIQISNQRFPGFINVVVDGGAGIGSFVDRVLKGSTGCKVIAFEPLPENVKVLRSRFNAISSVDIREQALGDRSTLVSFDVPERKGIPNSLWEPGTSYDGHVRRKGVLPTVKRFAKMILRPGSSSQKVETICVKMVRLDSALGACPDVVKLDLQGGEPEALIGLGGLLPQAKVAKVEIQMLSGKVRGRCVQLLKDAGFFFLVEDLQFAVPEMTKELRRALNEIGVEIEYEGRLHPSDPLVMVKGSWPAGRPLPIQNGELTREFASVLAAAKAIYFQVDLVALNGRYAEQWRSLLPVELLERSGMAALVAK